MTTKKHVSPAEAAEDPDHEPPRADSYDDAVTQDDRDGEQWAVLFRRACDGDEQQDEYPENWPQFSRRLREEMDWQCELCGRSFADSPERLHVHHKNGRKSDNGRSNLQVLCADCHAKQPGHFPFNG